MGESWGSDRKSGRAIGRVRGLKVEQNHEMSMKLDGIFPSEEEFIDRPRS